MNLSRVAIYGLFLLVVTGCLVPERFKAVVSINSDGSYTYSYVGTAVHAMAAAQLKKTGSLSVKDDAALKAEAEKMTRFAEVRRANYQGNARYDLQMEGKKKAGESLKLLGFLNVDTNKDGILTIASPEIKDRDKQALKEIGLIIDGTLDIKLPSNAEVISHNATSTPSYFGLFGSYSWKIGKIDQRPLMKIRLQH